MSLLLAIAFSAVQASATTQPAQASAVVRPETVTVGDPFRLLVRVRAPRGATIEFPTALDSGGKVEALDPVVVQPSADTTLVEQTATYRLAAWDTGRLPIVLSDILVRDASGERRLVMRNVAIHVRSVLPADSSQHIPKPPRDVLDVPPPWWWWLVLVSAILALLLLSWLWWRRHRRRPALVTDPLLLAERAFDRIDRLGLLPAGERARYAALVVEVLRDYLAGVVPLARTSLTSTELLVAVREESIVPVNALAAMLAEVDMVKFARRSISVERAATLGKEARNMVRSIDAARHAPPVTPGKAA